jgi:hypothetical protein
LPCHRDFAVTAETPLPRPIALEEFAPLVGKDMLADCTPKPIELVLVEAHPLRPSAFSSRQPFVLVFRSRPEILLVSGNYVMRCGAFGPDLIYISQIAQPPGGQLGNYYQAVFN